jgi:hypothetical protein
MNAKVTAVLVIVSAIAGVWYFKGDAWAPGIGTEASRAVPATSTAAETLDALAPAAISRVEINYPSGDSLLLERAATDSGWKLPGNWPLRRAEVEELVDLLGTLRTRFRPIPLEDAADLARYGLAPEQKPLIVKVASDRQLTTLALGEPKSTAGETPFARPAYVRVNDAPEVLRLGPDVMPVVRRPPDVYRRRNLFHDVERVRLAGSSSTPGQFGMPSSTDAPLTVSLPGEDTVSIRVARRVPTIWNLDLSGALSFLLVRVGRLPEPAIQSAGGEPVVQPERLADAWALDAPHRDRAEPAQLRGVLTAVSDLWVDSFAASDALDVRLAAGRLVAVPLDPFAGIARLCPLPADLRTGLADSAEMVTVQRKGVEAVTVRFGGIAKVAEREEMITVPGGPPGTPPQSIPTKAHSLYRFARVDGNPQVFVVDAEKLPRLFTSVNSITDPQVVRFSREEVRGIVLQSSNQPEIKLSLTKGDPKSKKPEEQQDRWFVEAKPNPLLADAARVDELLDQLTAFRASDQRRAVYSGDMPAAETRITLVLRDKRPEGEPEGPAREVALLVGKPDYAARRLPVRRDGWPRITMVDNTLGPDGRDSWVTGFLFPNTVSDLLARPALAYRNRKLFDAAAELAAVSVAGRFTLRRDPDAWKLTSPITSDADAGKAGELGNSLAGLAATEYLTERPTGDELRSFGLDAPVHKVSLEFRGGRAYTLELGAARPGKPEVFARLDGGAVFGLSNTIVEQLTTGVVGLLPLKVWTIPVDRVTAVEIVRPDAPAESYTLVKSDGNWQLTRPFSAPAPNTSVQPLLTAVGNLTAVRYHALTAAANAAEFGFDKPFFTLKLAHVDTKPLAIFEAPVVSALVVGAPTPDGAGRYARLDSPNAPVFVVPGTFAASALTPPLELLDRALLTLDPARIAKLHVASEKPEEDFTVAKGSTGKWAVEGISFAVDPERISRLTAAAAQPPIARLAAYGDAVKWADFGLDKPATVLTITLAGDKPETHTIAFGKTDPLGGRFVRIDSGKAVALLPTSAAAALARKKFEYADRTLLTFDPTTLTGIVRKQGKDELEVAPAAGLGWDIVKPAKQKADQQFVDELAEALGRLRAERVAAYGKKERVFKDYGLEPPAASISVTVGDKAEPRVLRIGNHVNSVAREGDRYAAVDSANAEVIVGVLPAALVNKLLAPAVAFRDHTLARFVDADRATLERGDRRITFAKVGVTWKVTEPVAAPAESSELETLVADLGKLRAETWVAEKSGANLKSFGLDKPAAKWTLTNGDQTVLILLLGNRTADGRVHVATDKGELIGLLDAAMSGRVLAEYRQRKPWELDAAQATEITITSSGGKFTLEKTGPTWTDPAKPDASIDSAKVNELLGALASLTVESYASDKDADLRLFGLDKPATTLTITSGGTRRVVEIGGAVGGADGKQRYARVADKDRSDVFVLTAADTARLTRDRAAYLMKK